LAFVEIIMETTFAGVSKQGARHRCILASVVTMLSWQASS